MQESSGLTDLELKICNARISDISLFTFDKKELPGIFNTILLRICALSGSTLPNDESFIFIIREELIDFILNFGYEDYTASEITLAFDINCSINLKYPSGIDANRISLFGQYLSVDYISKILFNYSGLRNLLDRKFQNQIDGY